MANTKKYVSLDKLGLYDEKIKGVISAGDAATLASANAYADGLATNYDVAGAAASAEVAAKSYTDAEVAKANAAAAAAQAQADKGVADAATAQAAAEAAQTAADTAQSEVDALETYVGTIPEGYTEASVVAYIDKKAAETLAAASGNSTETAASVKAQLDTYKTENDKAVADVKATAEQGVADAATAQAAADAAQADIDTFVGETYATDKAALIAEDARIAGLVATEQARAEGVESGLDERLVEVEAFFKLAEGEQLDTALDTLKEIQTYITTEGAAADQMVLDIAANAKAIEDMDVAYKAADTAIKGRLDVLEAIDHEAYVAADTSLKNELNGEIAKKADKTYVDEQVEALQGVDSGFETRIAGLEAKFGDGEGNVESQIATAKQEAIDAAASAADAKDEVVLAAAKKYADDEDAKIEERVSALEGASATHALKSEVEAVAGRMTTAEGEIDTLQSEMDAVEALAAANKAAHEANAAAIALKASQEDLTAVSNRVTTLETWHSNFVEVSEEDINALFA